MMFQPPSLAKAPSETQFTSVIPQSFLKEAPKV